MLSKASALSHGLVLQAMLGSINKANPYFSAVLLSTTVTSLTYGRSSLLGKRKLHLR